MSYLSLERQYAMSCKLVEWYEQLGDGRTKQVEKLGISSGLINVWKRGLRAISPRHLPILRRQTGSNVFSLTHAEREKYAQTGRATMPPIEDLPILSEDDAKDFAAVSIPEEYRRRATNDYVPVPRGPRKKSEETRAGPMSLDDLVQQMMDLIDELHQVSQLPAGNPTREAARKMLVAPAMQLFSAATSLSLEFPEEFSDLLEQLELAQLIN